ncbi:hypothetical protein BX661DRAFT_196108 [Kickxella alabastrina]|uniref:uncharacterized protein n=2 Tax=Kickxella alabastrina TaxID=61397 RepID=UPI00221F0D67|nr:uncharacterized protein BX661DRAFT_196108 [Kickxella alabastrina]KAI7834384.1 hypothetical protein BX661DRAFT_196108 [Kickxella alabastrina]
MQINIAFAACIVAAAATTVAAQDTLTSTTSTTTPAGVNYAPGSIDTGSMAPPSFSPLANVNSHLARMVSFLDMSRISNVETTSPVMLTTVFDPAINKFTHLTLNVMQTSNGAYYLPVCAVDSITAAGPDQVASTDSCQFGIQMSSVPANVVRTKLGAVQSLFRAIRSAASHPVFNLGGFSMTSTTSPQSGASAGMQAM